MCSSRATRCIFQEHPETALSRCFISNFFFARKDHPVHLPPSPRSAATHRTAPQAAAAAAAATTNKQTAMMALVKGPTPKDSLVTHQHAPARGLSWAASVRLGCTLVRRRTHSPALFEVARDRSRLCHLHLPTRSHPHRAPLRLAAVTAAAGERAHRHARVFKGAIAHPPCTV